MSDDVQRQLDQARDNGRMFQSLDNITQNVALLLQRMAFFESRIELKADKFEVNEQDKSFHIELLEISKQCKTDADFHRKSLEDLRGKFLQFIGATSVLSAGLAMIVAALIKKFIG